MLKEVCFVNLMCMDLIAATRAEGGLVFLLFGCIKFAFHQETPFRRSLGEFTCGCRKIGF